MRLDQFQVLLQSLSPEQFEMLVADLLKRSGRFKQVRLEGGPIDQGVDIEAMEDDPLLGRPIRWVFQVKKTRVVGVDVARYMYAIADIVRRQGPSQVVLVAAGNITHSARGFLAQTGIQVWDSQKLAELATPDLLAEWFGSRSGAVTPDDAVSEKANAFRAALDATVPGKEDWSAASLGEMLELKTGGGAPQEVIRRKLADFRMSL